jgi:hypothetical protein
MNYIKSLLLVCPFGLFSQNFVNNLNVQATNNSNDNVQVQSFSNISLSNVSNNNVNRNINTVVRSGNSITQAKPNLNPQSTTAVTQTRRRPVRVASSNTTTNTNVARTTRTHSHQRANATINTAVAVQTPQPPAQGNQSVPAATVQAPVVNQEQQNIYYGENVIYANVSRASGNDNNNDNNANPAEKIILQNKEVEQSSGNDFTISLPRWSFPKGSGISSGASHHVKKNGIKKFFIKHSRKHAAKKGGKKKKFILDKCCTWM